MTDCRKFWFQLKFALFWKRESLAVGLWRWSLFLVLTQCIAEFVWKCSWLFTTMSINVKMYSPVRGKIPNSMNRFLHEFLYLTPATILTFLFCKAYISSPRDQCWEFFSSPPCPDRLWDPYSLVYNRYRGLFPQKWSGLDVNLSTHLHLVPRLRMTGAILQLPNTSSSHGA
jgi:hypothetical protein